MSADAISAAYSAFERAMPHVPRQIGAVEMDAVRAACEAYVASLRREPEKARTDCNDRGCGQCTVCVDRLAPPAPTEAEDVERVSRGLRIAEDRGDPASWDRLTSQVSKDQLERVRESYRRMARYVLSLPRRAPAPSEEFVRAADALRAVVWKDGPAMTLNGGWPALGAAAVAFDRARSRVGEGELTVSDVFRACAKVAAHSAQEAEEEHRKARVGSYLWERSEAKAHESSLIELRIMGLDGAPAMETFTMSDRTRREIDKRTRPTPPAPDAQRGA